jgi:aminoglycoside phosphotransferase (APT) family kinase protein
MVHAVVAEPVTVSLVLRGPAIKDRFLVMDRKTGESWWQHGASQESIASATKKQMSLERLGDVIDSLREWNLF